MSQKLSIDDLIGLKIYLYLMKVWLKNYNEDSETRYFLKVDIKYLEQLQKLHNDLLFLPKRMKIGSCKKLVWSLYDKKSMLCI